MQRVQIFRPTCTIGLCLLLGLNLCLGTQAEDVVPTIAADHPSLTSFVLKNSDSIRSSPVNFTVKVKGRPLPTCSGWYRDFGQQTWKKKGDDFLCIEHSNHSDSRTFQLVIKDPTSHRIGKFGVLFNNSVGFLLYRFELKVEDNDEIVQMYYVLTAVGAAVAVIIITILSIIIAVCRKRCLKRKRRRTIRDNEQSDSIDADTNDALSISTVASKQAGTSYPNSFRRPALLPKPKPKPKPKPQTLLNSESGVFHASNMESQDSSSSPTLPIPRPCATSTMHEGYVEMNGSDKFIYADQEEIAKAITFTLKRFKIQSRKNSSLWKSKRMSQSVPSLCLDDTDQEVHFNVPSRHTPKLQPLYSTCRVRNECNNTSHRRLPWTPTLLSPCSPGNASQNRQFYGGSTNSGPGFTADSDNEDKADSSTSTLAAAEQQRRSRSRRRRNSSENDPNYNKYWRRSLEINSEKLRASDQQSTTERLSELKYMSMASYEQGPKGPQTPRAALGPRVPELPLPPPLSPSPPLPLPPPPPSPPSDSGLNPVYQNIHDVFSGHEYGEYDHGLYSLCT